jgi:endoglucanase
MSTGGVISGTPIAAGVSTFQIIAANANGNSSAIVLSITVNNIVQTTTTGTTPTGGTDTTTTSGNTEETTTTTTGTTTITTVTTTSATTTTLAQGPSIILGQAGLLTFPAAEVGYASQAWVSVNITNNGDVDTGAITIVLSGANANAFEVSPQPGFGSGVLRGQSRPLTVRPLPGLAVGTYTATITVSGVPTLTARSFDMTFTVSAQTPVGTPNVIYRMADDTDIHLYAGLWESGGVSVHPLLASNGGVRVANLLQTPRTVNINGRTGSSQGVDFRLPALNARPNHHYSFEVQGRVTTGSGGHELWIRNVVESNPTNFARETGIANNADFSVKTNPITTAALSAVQGGVLRFGGASAQTIVITGIVVTAYCPSGCTCRPMFTRAPVTHTPFRNINAATLVGEIGVGWNLGNTLDGHNSDNPAELSARLRELNNPAEVETIWQGGRANRTSQEMISAVKAAGFNAIRIPVTWYKALENAPNGNAPGYIIDPRWLDHVQTIVDMAVREDMYIILNTHHEEWILRPGDANAVAAGSAYITAIWTQIANRFGGYNEKLIFEGLNEPRHRLNQWDTTAPGLNPDWNWSGEANIPGRGNVDMRPVINEWNQAFVNAVRATRTAHPNNGGRVLMLATYGAQGTPNPLAGFRLPTDPVTANLNSRLVMSVHVYSPHAWAHDGIGSYGSAGAAQITTDLGRVADTAAARGVPVIMGEWGTLARLSHSSRVTHAYDFTRAAADLGVRSTNPVVMRTFVWDTTRDRGNPADNGFLLIRKNSPFVSANSAQIIRAMLAGQRRETRPS